MKTLELEQLENVEGGCAGSVGMALVAAGSLALFLAFPPAGLAAAMGGGALAGIGFGGSTAGAIIDCFVEE